MYESCILREALVYRGSVGKVTVIHFNRQFMKGLMRSDSFTDFETIAG